MWFWGLVVKGRAWVFGNKRMKRQAGFRTEG